MKLSITATLTEEEVLILAKQKWWSETTTHFEWADLIETKNPQSAADFIVSVYQSMIITDATRVFTEYRTQELKQSILETEQLVKTDVETAITYSIK